MVTIAIFSSSDEETVDETAAVDDSEKTPEEKLKLLKRQSPELFPLLAELKVYKAEMSDLLIPLTKIFTSEGRVLFSLVYRMQIFGSNKVKIRSNNFENSLICHFSKVSQKREFLFKI